jgi:ADP-ribose pyrophosphatase YjhB (NUDIX family)
MKRHTYCSFCGEIFQENQPFPRTCTKCENVTYANPIPVTVILQPVDEGLLTIRRGVEPRIGELALPGGYIDMGESWQEAGARELWEETGIQINAGNIRHFATHSAPDGTVLVFGVAPEIRGEELDTPLMAFHPTNETSERIIITRPQLLAFPLHSQVVEDWFNKRVGQLDGWLIG